MRTPAADRFAGSRLAMVLLLAAMLAAAAPRRSADGVPFPDAADRKIVAPLPLIRDRLGGLPEDFTRVFSAEKSRDVLNSKAPALTRAQWFSVASPEADAVGLRLTDGRISYIQLAFNRAADPRLSALRDKLKPLHGKPTRGGSRFVVHDVPIDCFFDEGDASASISFRVQPVAWYLAYHDVSPEIADAMRHQQIIVGMTEEQALLSMDGIHHTLTDNNGAKTYKWDVVTRDNSQPDAAKAKNKAARTITALFIKGVATSVREVEHD